MKNVLTALTTGLVMMASTVCYATIPGTDIAVSGVAPGSSVTDARAKLGDPVTSHGDKLVFPNNIIVECAEYNYDLIEEIGTRSAGNVTSAGLQVGMPEASIMAAYGAPDKVDRDPDDTEYTYYSSGQDKKMEIEVVDGKIVKIKCKIRD